MTYYRCQASYDSQFTGKPIGIFGAVFGLIKRGIATDEEVAEYQRVLGWFNQNLPDPPFYDEGNPMQGVTWFTEAGRPMIEEMRPLLGILDRHGVSYEIVESENPGKVIYRDQYQIGVI